MPTSFSQRCTDSRSSMSPGSDGSGSPSVRATAGPLRPSRSGAKKLRPESGVGSSSNSSPVDAAESDERGESG